MSTELAPSAIEILESTPRTLRGLLGSLPEAAISSPGPEGWSPRDVLAHLLSVQQPAMIDRVRLMLENDEPPVPNIDEEAALVNSGYRERPAGELLDRFEKERAEAVAWVKGLPPESLARGGGHEVAGRITAADQLNHFAYHDLAHIRQICSLLIPRVERARGAMSDAFPDTG